MATKQTTIDPETMTMTNTKETVEGQLFLEIVPKRIKNNPHGSLMVHIQAPLMEDFFLSICRDAEEVRKYRNDPDRLKDYCHVLSKAKKPDGSPIYVMKLDRHVEMFVGKANDEIVLTQDFTSANMYVLAAVGISEGIDFLFEGVFNEEALESALKDLCKRTTYIYNSFMKQTNFKFKMFMQEIK